MIFDLLINRLINFLEPSFAASAYASTTKCESFIIKCLTGLLEKRYCLKQKAIIWRCYSNRCRLKPKKKN